jgi:transaldolase
VGQSLWLDSITRELIKGATLERYVEELGVTGLTSNPTSLAHAIRNGTAYDSAIDEKLRAGKSGEDVFVELAVEDVSRAAELLWPIHERTGGVDGWVSLDLSPLLAHDSVRTRDAAKELFLRVARSNVFIKIPGTKDGLRAIEKAIFAGVPVDVTLLFSRDQYLAAADAFLRGVERRIEAGLDPNIDSVASVCVRRWDVAVASRVPDALRNQLGIAIAKQTYKAYRKVLDSRRWERAYKAGVRPQRLLWASTGTKDPKASDVLYVKALAAPFTVNTMPEATLLALADHDELGEILSADGGGCEEVLTRFANAGVNVESLGHELQVEGAQSFVASWRKLMECIELKSSRISK